jgi:hypothetical protein
LNEKVKEFFKDSSNKEAFISDAENAVSVDKIDSVDKLSYMQSKINLYNVYQMLNRARALKAMF